MTSRRALQAVVVLGSLVPLAGGGAGMIAGPAMLGAAVSGGITGDLDSHYRYLSGLLFGLGLGFLSCVPAIETKGRRFRLLGMIVVMGGLGRTVARVVDGAPSAAMTFALVMELGVTPLLAFWQWRVAAQRPFPEG